MVTEIQLFECLDLTQLDFCLCGWKWSKVSKRKTDIRDELLARVLDGVPATSNEMKSN
jgi:hypothetical protein